MTVFNTDSIVLKQFDLGEADKIITFYSQDKGKVRAVARGVRKTKSSISGLVLPFSYNNVTIYQGRSLARINEIHGKYSFSKLREDLARMAYASYMAELVEKIGMENDPNEKLFSLLLTSFYHLSKVVDKKLNNVELSFKARLLGILGIRPELDKCTICEQPLNSQDLNYFAVDQGGLLCSDCYLTEDTRVTTISGESIQVLKELLWSGLKPVSNLHVSGSSIRELNQLIDDFISYHLDIQLKSYAFLHMIKEFG
jgi:DNA repair protein RecO (recombination protein O)